MKKRLISLVLCLSLLASCAADAGKIILDSPAVIDPISVEPVPDVPGEVHVDPDLPVTGDPAAALTAFGLELLRADRTEGENTLLSPLSVALALGMTANGAAGETAEDFKAVLGMDTETLNSLCAALLRDYRRLGGSTESTLVNSLWCDPRLTLDELFAARCRQIYGAELFYADLQTPATVKAVNKWVSDATRGLIPTVADRFSPDAVLALVNAIYLKNRFASPFNTPTSDWTMDFTNADGTVSRPNGMYQKRYLSYLEHDSGRGVVLPYDDGRLGLLLMLPDEGFSLTGYLSSWNGSTLSALLEGQSEEEVQLTVPKYELEWEGSLAKVLENLGLASAFDPSRADFSAMGRADGALYIGDVIHKTVLKVNEKGTEAAAVTMAVAECTAAFEPKQPLILTFDRPFVCSIVDLETGVPLFLGAVEHL